MFRKPHHHGTSFSTHRHRDSSRVPHHRDHPTCRPKPAGIRPFDHAGLRVGEIAALTIGDAATHSGEARREMKLGAHQTKGNKGRTVVLSHRVRAKIDARLESLPSPHPHAPLIASQRNGRAFTNVSLSMLFKEIYEAAGITYVVAFGKADFCHAPQCQRRRHAHYSEADGSQAHRHDELGLRRVRGHAPECCGSG